MLKVKSLANTIRPVAIHIAQLAAQAADETQRGRRPGREVDFAEEARLAIARVTRAEREAISAARESGGQPQVVLVKPDRRLMLLALGFRLRRELEHRALMFGRAVVDVELGPPL